MTVMCDHLLMDQEGMCKIIVAQNMSRLAGT